MWFLILILLSVPANAAITKETDTSYRKIREVSEVLDIKQSKLRIKAINAEIDSLQARIQSLRDEKAGLQADIEEAKQLGVIDLVVE